MMGIVYDREVQAMIAECDGCFHVVEFDAFEDFNDVKQQIDVDGWKTTKRDGKWVNICPDCK